ncbi:Tat binding protein 1(TBP-1)-interacting protein (TBPIP) family protein [Brugia pahangi]
MPSNVSTLTKCELDEVVIEMVCRYMLQQNRPYSAIDVWNNLRQEYPKAVIKCLDVGVERGFLCEKLISKQKIYFADQSKTEKCNEEELQAMNESIIEKKNRLNELSNEIKVIKNELKEYGSAMRIEEMIALQTTLKTQIKEMEKRISGMVTHAKDEVVNEKRKSELAAKQEYYTGQYKERKRIADRIVDVICENVNISKKKLMEDIGFELD